MERPILFSGEMVRAILAGRKTQTRRVVRIPERPGLVAHPEDAFPDPGLGGGGYLHVPYTSATDRYTHRVWYPYGIGTRLWVRETWATWPEGEIRIRHTDTLYRADEPRTAVQRWRPSTQMPRWASRITLEVTAVRAERLHDITEEDACAEGVEASATTWVRHEPNGDWELSAEPFDGATPERATARDVYERLWHAINGKRAPWSSNPWVWVVSFRKAVA